MMASSLGPFGEERMDRPDVDRRDFHKWTLAAFSGMLAGSMPGCSETPAPPAGKAGPAPDLGKTAPVEIALTEKQVELLTDDVHTCRGLNTCKGQGRSKDNDCAGQGTCASVADHSCGENNECATLGGCGATAGLNECKGKGGCHVPLMDSAWEKARAAFETAMKKVDKPVGAAPPAKKE